VLLWRCARHSDHIATITTDIPFGDTEAHSATETPDGFADDKRQASERFFPSQHSPTKSGNRLPVSCRLSPSIPQSFLPVHGVPQVEFQLFAMRSRRRRQPILLMTDNQEHTGGGGAGTGRATGGGNWNWGCLELESAGTGAGAGRGYRLSSVFSKSRGGKCKNFQTVMADSDGSGQR